MLVSLVMVRPGNGWLLLPNIKGLVPVDPWGQREQKGKGDNGVRGAGDRRGQDGQGSHRDPEGPEG